MKRLAFSVSVVALAFASPAQADPITLDSGDVGTSFSVNYNGFSGSTVVNGLTALANFTLTAFTGNSATFNYSVTNTTQSPVTSRISSFAFNTNPDLTGAYSTGDYPYTVLDSNYPNGIGTVDVCFKAGGSNSCSGNGGLTNGETGSGTLTMLFSQPLSALTIEDFFIRYQSITGAGSVSSATGTGVSSISGGTQVPEPGMLAMFGLSALGLMYARRRRTSMPGRPFTA